MAEKPTYEELEQTIAELKEAMGRLQNTEAALRECEKKLISVERLQQATSSAGIGIWDWNIETNEMTCDDRMMEFYGIEKNSSPIDYDFWMSRIHPDDRDKSRQFSDETTKEKREYTTEYRVVRPDGTVRFLKTHGQVIRNTEGEPIRMLGVSFDITDHRQTEDQLIEINTIFHALLKNCPIYIFFKDHNIRPVFLSHNYETMLGMPLERILGKTMDDLFPSDVAKKMIADDKKILHEGKIIQVDEELNGRHFTTIKFPIAISGKEPMLAGITIDITEQKLSEATRLELEEQLRQSQKMESIGTLAGGIAHEFNNVLSIILGNNELIIDELPAWSPVRESSEEIKAACLRARDFIKQLLLFSRKDEAMKTPIEIASVVNDTIKLIRSSTPANINIYQELSPDVFPILGNATQINQVLINLCSNAGDAMSQNGGTISISLINDYLDNEKGNIHPSITTGQYVRLMVSDTGSGMNTETIEKIFEPYFTTKEIGKGTGIGLSVVHGIVERHGGSISVKSKPDEGTIFTIFFPAYMGDVEQKSDHRPVLPTGNERILFVDDEHSIVNLGRQRLEKLGYTVLDTTNPTEALQIFRNDPDGFDLVITDMSMPHMTGDQLIKEILKLRPGIPTILCTGYSEKISEETAGDIGARKFIIKPIDRTELAVSIREVLDEVNGNT